MLRRSLLQQTRSIASSAQQLPFRTASPAPLTAALQPILSSRIPAPARSRILSRWYSSAQSEAQKEDSATEKKQEGGDKEQGKEEDPMKKELEAKNREITELKDKYLRQVADYRNLQERTKREQQSARDFAIQKFARDLIESIDTFDLALSAVPGEKLTAPASEAEEDPNKELRQLHSGLKMTETVMLNTLKKHGLERFDPSETAEKFDPNLHEATFQTPQPDKEDGSVFHTTQKGFILNGRVLRAAKVGVVKNS